MSITTDNIPPEVAEAAAKAAYNNWRDKTRAEEKGIMPPDMLDEVAPEWANLGKNQQDWIDQARAALLAALAAWPNKLENGHDEGLILTSAAIILPLPQPKEPSE